MYNKELSNMLFPRYKRNNKKFPYEMYKFLLYFNRITVNFFFLQLIYNSLCLAKIYGSTSRDHQDDLLLHIYCGHVQL